MARPRTWRRLFRRLAGLAAIGAAEGFVQRQVARVQRASAAFYVV
jgi:hypothetical protein